MTYCKVVQALNGTVGKYKQWILTHECGKMEHREMTYTRNGFRKPAPTKVRCEGKQDG